MQAALDVGPQVVVQTEGDEGCYTVSRNEQFHTPAFDCPVIDTTGAGDVFHGAYIVGLLQGWTLQQCALFSTAVASMKCGSLGGRAGIPHYDQVLDYLGKKGFDVSNYLG
jgi:sugar/nucleoside kinase (ribokinase family)